MHTNGATYRMNLGQKLSFCCRGARELGVAMLVIIDNFLNAVFWILRTGAPWRDLSPSYGDWKNTHQRFCHWRDKDIWERLLEELIDNSEFELLMINASHVKVHTHGSGARCGSQDMAKTKGDSTPTYIGPWMRMVCRSESLLQKVPQRIVSRLKP